MARNQLINGKLVPLTKEEETARDAEEAQAKIDKAAYGYKSERRASYPSIREQLDMQYWDKKNGTTTWVDAITKVKTDNPKP